MVGGGKREKKEESINHVGHVESVGGRGEIGGRWGKKREEYPIFNEEGKRGGSLMNKKTFFLCIIPSLPCVFLYLLVLSYKFLETLPSHAPTTDEYIWGFILFIVYFISIVLSMVSSFVGVIIGFIISGVSSENENEDKSTLGFFMLLFSSISVVLTGFVIVDTMTIM